ncbi:MarC family protein [Zobellia nedashkovskayae]
MDNLITFSITVFTGFFAIMNPLSNMPIFLSLVGGADRKTQRTISKKATLTAFIIVTIFLVLGKFIFLLFGITIPAFKITGGILIFFVGFDMLQSKKSNVKHLTDTHIDEDLAISPLAIPILALTRNNRYRNEFRFKCGLPQDWCGYIYFRAVMLANLFFIHVK